jgi:hypothetical protein
MGLFAPSEEPVIKLHSVDVMELDTKNLVMELTVHIACWEHELQSLKVKQRVDKSIKRTLNYLIAEGFISSVKGWNLAVAVLGHPPKEF